MQLKRRLLSKIIFLFECNLVICKPGLSRKFLIWSIRRANYFFSLELTNWFLYYHAIKYPTLFELSNHFKCRRSIFFDTGVLVGFFVGVNPTMPKVKGSNPHANSLFSEEQRTKNKWSEERNKKREAKNIELHDVKRKKVWVGG